MTATLVAPITVSGTTEYQWTARLTGLQPSSTYCSHVTEGGQDLQNGTATTFTAPVPTGSTTPFSFAVIGDFGGGTSDEANVLARVRAGLASFVVSVGDNAYPDGTQSDYGDVDGGNVFDSDDWPLGQGEPWFLAHGNHGFDVSGPFLQNFPETDAAATSGGRMQEDQYCCIAGSPMVSYITGTGGADLLSTVQGCSTFDAYAIGGSGTSCHAPPPASDSHVFGYLLVTVSGTTVTVTPTDEHGATFDVQTYRF